MLVVVLLVVVVVLVVVVLVVVVLVVFVVDAVDGNPRNLSSLSVWLNRPKMRSAVVVKLLL